MDRRRQIAALALVFAVNIALIALAQGLQAAPGRRPAAAPTAAAPTAAAYRNSLCPPDAAQR